MKTSEVKITPAPCPDCGSQYHLQDGPAGWYCPKCGLTIQPRIKAGFSPTPIPRYASAPEMPEMSEAQIKFIINTYLTGITVQLERIETTLKSIENNLQTP